MLESWERIHSTLTIFFFKPYLFVRCEDIVRLFRSHHQSSYSPNEQTHNILWFLPHLIGCYRPRFDIFVLLKKFVPAKKAAKSNIWKKSWSICTWWRPCWLRSQWCCQIWFLVVSKTYLTWTVSTRWLHSQVYTTTLKIQYYVATPKGHQGVKCVR